MANHTCQMENCFNKADGQMARPDGTLDHRLDETVAGFWVCSSCSFKIIDLYFKKGRGKWTLVG